MKAKRAKRHDGLSVKARRKQSERLPSDIHADHDEEHSAAEDSVAEVAEEDASLDALARHAFNADAQGDDGDVKAVAPVRIANVAKVLFVLVACIGAFFLGSSVLRSIQLHSAEGHTTMLAAASAPAPMASLDGANSSVDSTTKTSLQPPASAPPPSPPRALLLGDPPSSPPPPFPPDTLLVGSQCAQPPPPTPPLPSPAPTPTPSSPLSPMPASTLASLCQGPTSASQPSLWPATLADEVCRFVWSASTPGAPPAAPSSPRSPPLQPPPPIPSMIAECLSLIQQYGIVPYVSWGSAAHLRDVQQRYEANHCNSAIGVMHRGSIESPYDERSRPWETPVWACEGFPNLAPGRGPVCFGPHMPGADWLSLGRETEHMSCSRFAPTGRLDTLHCLTAARLLAAAPSMPVGFDLFSGYSYYRLSDMFTFGSGCGTTQ